MSKQVFIDEALQILADLGLPPAQRNERSALTLLALIDLQPDGKWTALKSPLMGITPVMDWIAKHYGKQYAPNTRETIRRQTMHQFVDAGIALYNPDDPLRSVNSPKAVYQISPACLALLKTHGTASWDDKLLAYSEQWQTLADRYAREREMNMIPVKMPEGKSLKLSPGEHSELIKAIIEQFAPRVPLLGIEMTAVLRFQRLDGFDLEQRRDIVHRQSFEAGSAVSPVATVAGTLSAS